MSEVALAATQTVPFTIGSLLSERYELKTLLGEGGMGTVFRAHDRELDEDVALKILHVEAESDTATLTRFRREVKLARRVTHRNVARTFDLGFHRNLDGSRVRFLTMELIEGRSLAQQAQSGAMKLPDALRVAAEIARGLAAAHTVGVVHRDLKPDNVMLSEERVVLTDFGIARIADGEAAEVMRTGMVVGTPAYMAPEQLENGAIDGRTDVYALGTILFQLLTCQLPFKGESAISLAAQRLTTDAPDVRSVDKSIPDAVAALVREMLLRRREDRPDAQAVLDRVEALRGNAAGQRGLLRTPMLTNDSVALLGQPRTVSVEPLAGSSELGALLTSAIVDALNESRLAHVAPAAAGATADLVVQGSVHTSSGRARVRLRLVGPRGASLWAGHVDGSAESSLDLEDGVVLAVVDAVRARVSATPMPADPSLREGYERARQELARFALPHVRAAVQILEELESQKPGDPHVRTLLARALLAAWGQTAARDRSLVARAEDLALRALQDDPSLSNAHHVIAYIRLDEGEIAAAVRANEESLRRDPRNAAAHLLIGELLCECLYVSEGRRRIELAARMAPNDPGQLFSRIEVGAMLGEQEAVRALLAELTAKSGPLSAVVAKTRVAIWWQDRAMALEAADTIDAARSGASWDAAAEMLRGYASGHPAASAPEKFRAITGGDVSPRHRSMLHEIAADYHACTGDRESSLDHIIKASRLAPFTNLLWLDCSPALVTVRADPRFAEARATVAARVAQLWGSVGPFPQE